MTELDAITAAVLDGIELPLAGNDLTDALESWSPVDLGPVVAGAHQTPRPEILRTLDGIDAFFYRGCVNSIHGDSGIGKSWIALAAVAQVLATGRHAIVVDFESNAAEVVERLRNLGAQPDAILERLTYIAPNDPTSTLAVALVIEAIVDHTDLVLVDSIGEAFGLDGIDENSDADVGPWLRRVARQIALAGPAVLLIDHSTKASDNPLHPSGSKRKRAAVTGASYLVLARAVPTRENAGTLTLTCAKDRHGTYPRGKQVATVDVTPYPDDGVSVTLHRAVPANADTILVAVAQAIVRLLKDEGRPMTGRELTERAPVKARGETKWAAIDLAVGRGAITVESGPRGSKLHTFRTDLTDEPNHDR